MTGPLPAHELVQFERTLAQAVERLCERSLPRCGGLEQTRAQFRSDPEGPGIGLTRFTRAFMEEELLNSAAGAAFLLVALSRRPVPASSGTDSTLGVHLQSLALNAFASLIREKASEHLERESMFGDAS